MNKKTSGGFGDKIKNLTDTNLLLSITIIVFFLMYIGAIIFQGQGFRNPQAFLNLLNANAALIILTWISSRLLLPWRVCSLPVV